MIIKLIIRKEKKMFKQFYGMSSNPFEKTLATKEAYLTSDIKEMNGRLEYLQKYQGIGVFSGNSGYGKTFALRHFAEGLNPNLTKFYYVCLSTVTTTEFYRQLCMVLGLEPAFHKVTMFQNLQEFFENTSNNKHIHCMLCLDEAQYLKNDILRELKMLCNFEMDSKNYVSLILLGQPTLLHVLNRQPHETLKQRVVVNYTFQGIKELEVKEYIKDRMHLVGASEGIFEENAMVCATSSCGGSLRKLNQILTKSLMVGATNQKQTIDSDMILAAVNDMEL